MARRDLLSSLQRFILKARDIPRGGLKCGWGGSEDLHHLLIHGISWMGPQSVRKRIFFPKHIYQFEDREVHAEDSACAVQVWVAMMQWILRMKNHPRYLLQAVRITPRKTSHGVKGHFEVPQPDSEGTY